jgi:methionyl-tRNA formyltransferase
MTKQIRVGLLIGPRLSGWFPETLRRTVEMDGVQITYIAEKDIPLKKSEGDTDPFIKRVFYSPIKKRIFSFDAPTYTISSQDFPNTPRKDQVEPIKVGNHRVTVSDEVCSKFEENCDIIIHNRFGILTGDILNATQYGVVGAHWGDLTKYRGSYPGLWQILNDENEIILTVQRFDEKLDGGDIIVEHPVSIKDIATPRKIKERAYEESKDLLPMVIEKIRDPETSFKKIEEADLGRNYKTSDATLKTKLKLIYKIILRRLEIWYNSTV